ncbi:MAG: hypothetical protein IIA51_00025 [Chloroflexi bacterium]|nr:hypothetical protein [Chloroflexota bacterium]MDK1044581.1 hypothetical protein [Anaerolineales bacterium]MCH8093530.1 hypothetical protein [Chloroflexota bacterium]MCH8337315.1 hypothetical protein [Chloroflexota bacterium]MCH8339932.1 hypothetical protein [Chloroflexota bacterium]
MSTIYKVSYVVQGGDHPGAILNEDKKPELGQRVTLGSNVFEVVEIVDLMPARGDFSFLHVTVKSIPS